MNETHEEGLQPTSTRVLLGQEEGEQAWDMTECVTCHAILGVSAVRPKPHRLNECITSLASRIQELSRV